MSSLTRFDITANCIGYTSESCHRVYVLRGQLGHGKACNTIAPHYELEYRRCVLHWCVKQSSQGLRTRIQVGILATYRFR
jgi:hypothetical protein